MLRVTLLCAVSVATAGAACPSYAGRPNVVHGEMCGSAACSASFTYPRDEVAPYCDPCLGVVSTTQSVFARKSGSGYLFTLLTVGDDNQTVFVPCNVCKDESRILCGDGDDDGGSNTVVIIVAVLCGLLVLVAAAGGVWWYVKRQQRAIIASQMQTNAEADKSLPQTV